MRRKKVLVIGNLESIFFYEFINCVLVKSDLFEINILNTGNASEISSNRASQLVSSGCRVLLNNQMLDKRKAFSKIEKLFLFISVFKKSYEYDVINLHYVDLTSLLLLFFSRKNNKIIASFYGSDLLRINKFSIFLINFFLRRADFITLENVYMKKKFSHVFSNKYDDKIVCAHLCTSEVDLIKKELKLAKRDECKKEFGIPKNKIVIMCGYNGNKAHKHISIIKALNNMNDDYKKEFYLLLHCSYGLEEEYKSELIKTIKLSGFDGNVFTKYMNGKELAHFRKCVNIMFNLQETDILSSSMLECMEAGSLVVKGDWLEYPEIESIDHFYISIRSFDEIVGHCISYLKNMNYYKEALKINENIIDIVSWKSSIEKWVNLFNSL